MKRAHTYRLPDETDATIKRLAKEDNVSEADVIVDAVARLSTGRQGEHEETPIPTDMVERLPDEEVKALPKIKRSDIPFTIIKAVPVRTPNGSHDVRIDRAIYGRDSLAELRANAKPLPKPKDAKKK